MDTLITRLEAIEELGLSSEGKLEARRDMITSAAGQNTLLAKAMDGGSLVEEIKPLLMLNRRLAEDKNACFGPAFAALNGVAKDLSGLVKTYTMWSEPGGRMPHLVSVDLSEEFDPLFVRKDFWRMARFTLSFILLTAVMVVGMQVYANMTDVRFIDPNAPFGVWCLISGMFGFIFLITELDTLTGSKFRTFVANRVALADEVEEQARVLDEYIHDAFFETKNTA